MPNQAPRKVRRSTTARCTSPSACGWMALQHRQGSGERPWTSTDALQSRAVWRPWQQALQKLASVCKQAASRVQLAAADTLQVASQSVATGLFSLTWQSCGTWARTAGCVLQAWMGAAQGCGIKCGVGGTKCVLHSGRGKRAYNTCNTQRYQITTSSADEQLQAHCACISGAPGQRQAALYLASALWRRQAQPAGNRCLLSRCPPA